MIDPLQVVKSDLSKSEEEEMLHTESRGKGTLSFADVFNLVTNAVSLARQGEALSVEEVSIRGDILKESKTQISRNDGPV